MDYSDSNRHQEYQYLRWMDKILHNGIDQDDRTGVGVRALPGITMRFNVSEDHFPAVTTKKLAFQSMVVELLWFLRGDTNTQWLTDRKCRIWNEWADESGELGPVYGKQWREWFGTHEDVDQIGNAIDAIKFTPNSRRMIVSAWNVSDLPEMKLPPCHAFFQFTVFNGKLNIHLTQRSGDMFLGVPFNIASYSLLLMIMAKETGLEPGELIYTVNHAHIYHNHFDQVREQLSRDTYDFPSIKISDSIFQNGILNWLDNECKDISLEEIKQLFALKNYEHHSTIKAQVAV